MNVKVKLTEYKDRLVIETVDPEKEDYPGWTPIGPGRFGCVLAGSKTGLGASEEALAWLRGVKRGRDAIGDIDWFACNDDRKAFAWFGGFFRIVGRDAEGSRSYAVFADDCVSIPNDVPEGARDAIDAKAEE